MYEFFELLNCPVVKIDVFAFVFDGAHVIHEALRVESPFEDFVSEKDLFALFSLGVLHMLVWDERYFEMKSNACLIIINVKMLKLSNYQNQIKPTYQKAAYQN